MEAKAVAVADDLLIAIGILSAFGIAYVGTSSSLDSKELEDFAQHFKDLGAHDADDDLEDWMKENGYMDESGNLTDAWFQHLQDEGYDITRDDITGGGSGGNNDDDGSDWWKTIRRVVKNKDISLGTSALLTGSLVAAVSAFLKHGKYGNTISPGSKLEYLSNYSEACEFLDAVSSYEYSYVTMECNSDSGDGRHVIEFVGISGCRVAYSASPRNDRFHFGYSYCHSDSGFDKYRAYFIINAKTGKVTYVSNPTITHGNKDGWESFTLSIDGHYYKGLGPYWHETNIPVFDTEEDAKAYVWNKNNSSPLDPEPASPVNPNTVGNSSKIQDDIDNNRPLAPIAPTINIPDMSLLLQYLQNLNNTDDENEKQAIVDKFIDDVNSGSGSDSGSDSDEDKKPVVPNPDIDPDNPINPDNPVNPDIDPDNPISPDNPVNPDIPDNPDFEIDPNSPDLPEGFSKEQFKLPESIKDKFPFCVPFDIVRAFKTLGSQGRSAPYFEIPIKSEKFNIDYTFIVDLSTFDSVAAVLRNMEMLLFIVGLAFSTRALIRG